MAARGRAAVLAAHLAPPVDAPPQLEPVAATGSNARQAVAALGVDVVALRRLLDGKYHAVKDRVREVSTVSPCLRFSGLEVSNQDVYRAKVWEGVKVLLSERIVRLQDMRDDFGKVAAWFDALGLFDHSVAIKLAVQYSLFGQTVLRLGTKRHAHILHLAESGQLPGIFAMTELGHGTNVQQLQTTATYDASSHEFVINSPTYEAQKYWPGNIALHGQAATVFARLILHGKDHGIHVFYVPTRSPQGTLLPGVSVRDIGPKTCHLGVDNGGMSFNQVRIPGDNMLNRFADVLPGGKYVSKLATPQRHFGAAVGTLVGGRLVIASLAVSSLKAGLAIAVPYCARRRQFGRPSAPSSELTLLQYPTTHRRLAPYVARCVVMQLLLNHAGEHFSINPDAQVHALMAGVKAFFSWDAITGLQLARECMGSQAFIMHNRVAQLRNDADMYLTGEGDNVVLTQQVAKYLLAAHARQTKASPGVFTGDLAFLNCSDTGRWLSTDGTGISLLHDRQWQAATLQFRLRKLTQRFLHAMLRVAGDKDASFDMLNTCMPAVIDMARAYVDYHSFIIARNALSAMGRSSLRPLMELVLSLDVVHAVNRDLAWYLSQEWVATQHAPHVDAEFGRLCARVADAAPGIVDAFGVPEPWRGRCLL